MQAVSRIPTDQVEIKDLDTFVRALFHWHTNKVATINHMKSIPEGTEVTVDDGPKAILEGPMLEGFQLGLAYALSELGTLPFSFTLEDADAGGADDAPSVGASLN